MLQNTKQNRFRRVVEIWFFNTSLLHLLLTWSGKCVKRKLQICKNLLNTINILFAYSTYSIIYNSYKKKLVPHLISDRLLIIEAYPLVAVNCVRHLHLVIPNVRAAVPQDFTNLWEKKQLISFCITNLSISNLYRTNTSSKLSQCGKSFKRA